MSFRTRDKGYELFQNAIVSPLLNVSRSVHGACTASIIAGVAGACIKVYSVVVAPSSSAVTAGSLDKFMFFSTGGATTAISGSISPPINLVPIVLPYNQQGWYTTAQGDGLFVVTTNSVSIEIDVQAACIR